jgi:hypothetical protein
MRPWNLKRRRLMAHCCCSSLVLMMNPAWSLSMITILHGQKLQPNSPPSLLFYLIQSRSTVHCTKLIMCDLHILIVIAGGYP